MSWNDSTFYLRLLAHCVSERLKVCRSNCTGHALFVYYFCIQSFDFCVKNVLYFLQNSVGLKTYGWSTHVFNIWVHIWTSIFTIFFFTYARFFVFVINYEWFSKAFNNRWHRWALWETSRNEHMVMHCWTNT